jgi:hypothetical protein
VKQEEGLGSLVKEVEAVFSSKKSLRSTRHIEFSDTYTKH